MKKKYLFTLAFIIGVSFLVFHQVQAGETLTVCASGCDYTTISAAVDAASDDENDPDTISVQAGTYDEAITIQKRVIIIGSSAEEVIVTNDSDHVFYIDSDGAST